jgi:flagellar biosynthesis/type III secretory pathway M-ring protein FliF/YscJ
MEQTAVKKNEFKSESSIFSHPIQKPWKSAPMLPTWALILALIVAFFILKGFIYISDQKRHGK